MSSNIVAVDNRLWATADQLRANTGLKPAELSATVEHMATSRLHSGPLAARDE